MKRLHIEVCPLCGGRQLDSVMTCVDHYASGESYELRRCASCGFLLTQDVPVEAEIGRYYEAPDYISHTDTHRGVVNRLYHGVRRWLLRRKHRLVVQWTGLRNGRLLDIGAGTGYFARYMAQKGWKVDAIEKSPQARAFAKEHFGLDMMDESALWRIPADSQDVITLWHVMEHIESLDATWDRLYDLLAERGVLVVAVPNSVSYDAAYYGAYWGAYDVPRHLWHFSPATIQQWGAKHDFILAAEYPMPFDAFYVSMLSEKYMKHRLPFVRGMWRGTLAWLHALPKKEKSSSMIYVFRKKKK